MRVTANDYMTLDIMDKAYDEQVKLKETFLEKLNKIVLLNKPDVSKGEYTLAYPSFINIIEQNIVSLIENGYIHSGMQPPIIWKGELGDVRRFGYLDVNRWFDTFEQLEELIHSLAAASLITGTFSTGDDRTRQLIRTVDKYG